MMTVIWGMVSPMPLKAAASQLEVSVPDNKVLTYKQAIKRSSKYVSLIRAKSDLTKITVVPKLRNSGDKWPFQTEYQSYSQTIETTGGRKSGEVSLIYSKEERRCGTIHFKLRYICLWRRRRRGVKYKFLLCQYCSKRAAETTDGRR